MNRFLVTVVVLAILPIGAPAQYKAALPPTQQPSFSRLEMEATARLRTETIREVTVKLASPEMEGRGTSQRGGDRAAAYLAARFEKIGLKPRGDDRTFLQEIPLRIERALPDSSFSAGEVRFKFKDDFVVVESYPAEQSDRSASLVFVGYGVVSSDMKRNDLAGVDIKGKIVVLLDGKPKGVGNDLWDKINFPLSVSEKLTSMGAVGFIFAHVVEDSEGAAYSAQRPFSLAASFATRRRVQCMCAPPPRGVPPSILISPSAAEKVFAGSGISYAEARQKAEAGEFVSRDLGKHASLSVRVSHESGKGSNVIGMVEGSDAMLKDQAVVYTAHYDAYGIEVDGTIFPGAADNALGVGKLVAIAEVFARMKPRPRRSILFIAFSGEEYGLLGSSYWLQRPTWPIEKVAADINYDGIGADVWGKLTQITDLGFGHSDLDAVIAGVAAASNIAVVPDPAPQEESMYRTDSYSFLKYGIPALALEAAQHSDQTARRREWEFRDYHMPTDTVRSDWEWEGARALSVLGLITGMRIANQDAIPAWHPASIFNQPRGTPPRPGVR